MVKSGLTYVFYRCISHVFSFLTSTWPTTPYERLNDESCLIIPSNPSFSPLCPPPTLLGRHLSPSLPSISPLLPFPLLVTTWMCHCFYHFRRSCPLKRIEVISGVPKQCQETAFSPSLSLSLPPPCTNHHLLIPNGTPDTLCGHQPGL